MKDKLLKLFTLICCLVFIVPSTFAQKKGFNVLHEEKIFGKNYLNNSDIKGEEILFKNMIHNVFPDSASHYLTFQLEGRNKRGTILQYDLLNKKIVWTKAIDYETCELLKFDNLLIFNDYNEAYVIDKHTGDHLSKVVNYIYLANPEYNVGMAYLYIADGDGYYTNDFMGIDLTTSKLMWKRKISREYGWNDFFYLNDSTLLVVASGLHAINVKNGTGWDYNAVTGVSLHNNNVDAGAIVGAVIGGILGGLIGGVIAGAITGYSGGGFYYIPIYYPATEAVSNVIHNIVSNTLTDSTFIYFAAREAIVKVDKYSGEIVWKYKFQEELMSSSSIFMDDSVVYLVNKGFAFQGNRQLNYGKTFIAAFDKQTGEQKYISMLNINNEQIVDFKQRENIIYLLFQHHIAQYHLETGNLILAKELPYKEGGDFVSFVGNQTFIFKDGNLLNLLQDDTTKIHVYTTQPQILSLDNQCKITNMMSPHNTGVSFLCYNDYKFIIQDFITNDRKAFIINKDRKLVAEVDITANAFINGNMLYDKRENRLIAIDLNNIINK